MILGIGFPNPIGWAIDKVTDFIGGVATAGFEMIIGGLVAWVVDAVMWVVGGVFNFFLDSSDPNVQADWFITGSGPYATTAGIGATLLALFVLAGIVQGTLNGDVGRSEEHTSELQSLMRISYAVFCLKKKKKKT